MSTKEREMLDIYSDYIISSFGQITETGLSTLLNGEIKHDKITDFCNYSARYENTQK